MAYPATSNFRLGARGSAYWKYQQGNGVLQACASQGLSVIKGAQEFLLTHPPAHAGAVADGIVFGSHVANHTAVRADGAVGPNTIKSLYKYLLDAGVEANLLADLESDFNDNNQTNTVGVDVSRPGAALRGGTVRALIWAASYGTSGDLRRIELSSTIVPPLWGVAPANDAPASGMRTCWDPATEPVPVDAGGSAEGTLVVPHTTALNAPSEPVATGMSTTAKVVIGVTIGLTVLGIGTAIAMSGSKRRKKRRGY